tara:strand:+ start:284 stop:472 length:189 start_codon:yes stop_codon:yes gene_type:complete
MLYPAEIKNAEKVENINELELEYSHGDCMEYEVYWSPVTKKSYMIDLILEDARKWNTIREVE